MGVLVSDAPDTVSAARFTTQRARGRAGDRLAPGRPRRPARRGRQLGLLERGRRPARPRHRRGHAGRGRGRSSGVEAGQVGVASTGVIGIELPREPVLAGVRAACDGARPATPPTFSEAILTSDSGPKRACLEVSSAGGAVRARRPGQGRRDDLAALRHDVLLRADRRRARAPRRSTCSPACASSARSTASPSTASSPRATPCSPWPAARSGVRVEPESDDELRLGEALDALLRQLALEIVADGEGAERVGRVRGERPPRRRRAGGALGRQLAAGQDRAARRRPQLRPHPPGRGAGLAGRRAVRRRPRDRGPPGGLGRRRRDRRRRAAGAGRARAAATRSSTRSPCPARAARPRSSSATSAADYVDFNASYTS